MDAWHNILFLPRRLFVWVGLLALFFAAGCIDLGEATVKGSFSVSTCEGWKSSKAWDMDARVTTVHNLGNTKDVAVVEVRVQTYPGSPTQRDSPIQDYLLVEIHNPHNIKVNQPITIYPYDPKIAGETPKGMGTDVAARAVLSLAHTCPKTALPFNSKGTITFQQFGKEKGDLIKGSVTLTLSSLRESSHKASGSVTANFSVSLATTLLLGEDYTTKP